jgi:hypothetical protein
MEVVFRRMTANAGLRWEYFNGRINAQDAPGPVRPGTALRSDGQYAELEPLVAASGRCVGDGKTALKLEANRYNQGQALGFARRYNSRPRFCEAGSRGLGRR